jgi:hypothetical protein
MSNKKDRANNVQGTDDHNEERTSHRPGTPQPRHDDNLSPKALAKGREEAKHNMEQAQELEKQRPIHSNKSHQSQE